MCIHNGFNFHFCDVVMDIDAQRINNCINKSGYNLITYSSHKFYIEIYRKNISKGDQLKTDPYIG